MTSWIILALLIIAVVLIPSGLHAPATLAAIFMLLVGTFIAVVLNRTGFVTISGVILLVLIDLAILGAVVGVPNGQLTLVYLPAYDLFAIAVIIAASILPPAFAFISAGTSIALILGDFVLQPHGADVTSAIQQYGAPSLVTRPIALMTVVAVVAFLWVRGTNAATQRADRAEDLAELERRQLEQRRQLEMGVQQLIETHVRLANNDYSARANLPQDNQLWQVGASLNNLVTRLQRAGQADFELRRTREELQRLAAAIDEARAGKRPFWPARSGTAVDLIIERIAPRTRQPLPPPHPGMEPSFGGMMPGIPEMQGMSGMPGAGARPPSPYPYTPYSEQSGPLNPMAGIPPIPMPGMPDFPAGPPATGSLNASWGQPSPFANSNRRQPGENSGGGNMGNVVPDNPWFAPPEGYES